MMQQAYELSDEQLMTRLDGPKADAAVSELYDRYSRTVYGVGIKNLGAHKRRHFTSVGQGHTRV